MNQKSLEFTLDVIKIPVTLNQDGKTRTLEIREMTSAVRDKHMDKMQSRMTRDTDGNLTSVNRFEGMHADLLSVCLWDLETNQLVKAEEIQSWPSSVVSQLYKSADEIHKVPSPEDDKAKNDSAVSG